MCEGNYNWSIDDLLTKNRTKAVKIFVTQNFSNSSSFLSAFLKTHCQLWGL